MEKVIVITGAGGVLCSGFAEFWQERAIRRKSLISLLKIWYLRQERLTADAVRIIARSSVYTEMTC